MIDLQGKKRCEVLGEYILDREATVRETAQKFGVSKSTVHKDVTFQLKYANPVLYEQVKKILENHKEIRHLRGGEATRRKYLERRSGGA